MDGIIRFRRSIRERVLRRYVLVEKMRQTNHSTVMHEILIEPDRGLSIGSPAGMAREYVALPSAVKKKIISARRKAEEEAP